jgi:SAM-dependent methyltransferase
VFVPFTEPLLDAASVGASERVLDIGCGTGETTRLCARRAVDGEALGVDLSTAMLERARARAVGEGLDNVTFIRADAQVHEFTPAWADLVVSRFGVMFFGDPVAAFTNIRQGMARGARLALVVWQALDRNEWFDVAREAVALGRALPTPEAGVPGPFGLSDPDATRAVLERAGFERVVVDELAAPFRMGTDVDHAVEMARDISTVRNLLEELDADGKAQALDALRDAMAAHDTGDGVVLDSHAWVVTALR